MKKLLRFPLTLLLLLVSTVSFAQVALEDFSSTPDSLHVKTSLQLNRIIKAHLFDTETYDDAIVYTNALLEKAQDTNSHLDIIRTYHYYSLIALSNGAYETSLAYATKGLNLAQARGYKGQILCFFYRSIARAYFFMGDYENSLKYAIKELKIARELQDYDREAFILNNIGLIKLDTGDKKDALKVLNLSLKLCDSLEKEKPERALAGRINSLLALGTNYIAFKKYDTAMHIYDKVYDLTEKDFPNQHTYLLSGYANIYTKLKEYDKAFQYLETTAKAADSLNLNDLIPHLHYIKGQVHYGMKAYDKAIFELKKVDSVITLGKSNSIELQNSYPILAKSYDALGNYEKAKENYEKFVALNEKNDDRKLDVISTIYELYDIDLLESQIKDLTQESNDQKEMLSSTKIIIIILILLILFLFGYFRYKSYQNQKRFEALLNKSTSVKKLKPVSKPKKIDRKKLIPEEKAQELLQKLEKLEQQQVFLDQNCTIAWLAKKMGTNASYASIIINDYRQKKFPEYLSELRIDYATERLKEDSRFRSYTIKSIAKDVGYKSSEAFSKSFKKINGIYPSYFIKKLTEQAQNAA
ncbi:tetratricopeptide repeat protein [Kordia sp.]|uniref:tetratricopeptide repeat protein n=1 Tax=Kordia sp. TaxID=1965332 RepID=UPI003D2AD87A